MIASYFTSSPQRASRQLMQLPMPLLQMMTSMVKFLRGNHSTLKVTADSMSKMHLMMRSLSFQFRLRESVLKGQNLFVSGLLSLTATCLLISNVTMMCLPIANLSLLPRTRTKKSQNGLLELGELVLTAKDDKSSSRSPIYW